MLYSGAFLLGQCCSSDFLLSFFSVYPRDGHSGCQIWVVSGHLVMTKKLEAVGLEHRSSSFPHLLANHSAMPTKYGAKVFNAWIGNIITKINTSKLMLFTLMMWGVWYHYVNTAWIDCAVQNCHSKRVFWIFWVHCQCVKPKNIRNLVSVHVHACLVKASACLRKFNSWTCSATPKCKPFFKLISCN